MLDLHSLDGYNRVVFGGRTRSVRDGNPNYSGGIVMALTRWSPVSGLAALEIDRLNRMFEAAWQGEPFSQGAWVPPVDIVETSGKDVVVRAELPDMKREDIKVTFENNVLTIEGERKASDEIKNEQYHRIERRYGSFRRSFTLPASVDGSRVQAAYQDGILKVTLPQRPEAKPRQITIEG
jgi:HSP20 family protein